MSPSISIVQSKIKTLQSEINRLKGKLIKEKQNESSAVIKKNRALGGINKNSSMSTINSKTRVAEREEKNRSKALEKQYSISKQIATKEIELSKKQQVLSSLQIKSHEELTNSHNKTLERLDQYQGALEFFQDEYENKLSLNPDSMLNKDFDVFISHANEDKEDFVKPLISQLTDKKISFFYDDLSIPWGSNIRKSLDAGIIRSKFCIVVISKPFLDKYWTTYELDGFLQKESISNTTVLLPIWHNISHEEIISVSPTLASRKAIISDSSTIEEIVEGLKAILKNDNASI